MKVFRADHQGSFLLGVRWWEQEVKIIQSGLPMYSHVYPRFVEVVLEQAFVEVFNEVKLNKEEILGTVADNIEKILKTNRSKANRSSRC